VLQRRLSTVRSATIAALAVAGLCACSGEGGAIQENVVEPGITAIDDAQALRCDADAETLRVATQSFEMLEGSPAENEGALLAGGYIREESDLFDIVDGQLIAVEPNCKGSVPVTAPSGSAPLTAPATDVGEIVTETEPSLPTMNADEVLATMTEDDIAAAGGTECARELAAIFAAGQTFVAREGRDPESLADLAGDLDAKPTLWTLDQDAKTLVPAPGSPCSDIFGETAPG